jgi:hypothetical protein
MPLWAWIGFGIFMVVVIVGLCVLNTICNRPQYEYNVDENGYPRQ